MKQNCAGGRGKIKLCKRANTIFWGGYINMHNSDVENNACLQRVMKAGRTEDCVIMSRLSDFES